MGSVKGLMRRGRWIGLPVIAVALLLGSPSALADPPVLDGMPSDMTVEATAPDGTNVTYTLPTASDDNPDPTVDCVPAPGGPFPLGPTIVTCTATDVATGETSAGSFTVTVVDTTPPTLSLPSPAPVEATSDLGAVVSFSVTAVDLVDPSPTVSCDHSSGDVFPLGNTTVNCTAKDAHDNTSAGGSFTVMVVDTTPPTLGDVPADITNVEATAVLTPVSYTPPTATDIVDGGVPVLCNHPSGSTFAVGTTTVSCTATDAHGNIGADTFTVTVVDTTPPSLILPTVPPAEATSAAGAAVTLGVTAVDLADPSPTVSCDHSSGAVFPLGSTTVSCTAKDAHNNTSLAGTFAVAVVDTTPPSLILPTVPPAEATSAAGAAVSFAVTAADLVDPSPTVSCDHSSGAVFPLGDTTVSCTAKDARNNASRGTFVVKVQDTIAPPEVSGLSARVGNRSVTLKWRNPSSPDFDHTVVFRSAPGARGLGTQVFTGLASQFRGRGLRNGVKYRFVVGSFDRAGNRSPGLAILATPTRSKLFGPADGATVAHPPVLHWAAVPRATYYNVQLFRDSQKVLTGRFSSAGTKLLSAWPRSTHLALKKTWRYSGHTYRLAKGVYRWLVWPAYGSPGANRYGSLLGQSTFVVTR